MNWKEQWNMLVKAAVNDWIEISKDYKLIK